MEDLGTEADAAVLLVLMAEPGGRPSTAIARARGGADRDTVSAEALDRVDADLAALKGDGVMALGFFDDRFPERLRRIPSPPAVLFCRGSLPEGGRPALAVIGTREPTTFGRTAAEKLTYAAGTKGFAIVSGLALGIDAIAHEAALAAGAPTVAVLGSGLGNVSPRQNRGLAERIVDGGGALLSEQPNDAPPSPQSLVSRNRLQTGLSDALLVCQTALKGGSLHTVRFAAEQGRPVWVAEPRGSGEASQGNIALLRRPARDLPSLLPAWRGQARLAERSGGTKPLARVVGSDGIEAWVSSLTGEADQGDAPDDEITLF